MRRPAPEGARKLRDNIGNQQVLQLRDLVLDPQLALLDPCELKLIYRRGLLQRFDRCFQIAMFLTENLDTSRNDFAVQPTRSKACNGTEDSSGREGPRSTPSGIPWQGE
jgi:hypothetical protein